MLFFDIYPFPLLSISLKRLNSVFISNLKIKSFDSEIGDLITLDFLFS